MENLYLQSGPSTVFLKLDDETVERRLAQLQAREVAGTHLVAVKPKADIDPSLYEGKGIYVTLSLEKAGESDRTYSVGAFLGSKSGYFWTVRCMKINNVWILASMEAGPVV
jgi:hypothetical protein